jgi:PAS domain S-box-containing protein
MLSFAGITIANETTQPNILIINSSHKGYAFTDRFISGIEAWFKKPVRKANLYYEYLDMMRVPLNNDQIKSCGRFISQKYQKTPMDIIITCDEDALLFSLQFRELIGKNIPIIFCGIPPEDKDMIKQQKNIYGLYFDYNFKTNFDMAVHIFPTRHKFIIIHDSSSLGKSIFSSIKKLETNYPENKFLYFNNQTSAEMIKAISGIKEDVVVFPTIYNRDRFGNDYSTEELTNLIASKAMIPIFGFIDYQSNRGIFGGYLYLGFQHGEQTALLAESILKTGHIPDSLYIDRAKYNTIFNFEGLEKFYVSESLLPQGAIISNKPFTYLQKYKNVLIPYVILIVSLLSFSVGLVFIIRKKNKIAKQLVRSEELFRLLTTNAKDMIFRFDSLPEPHFTFMSPAVEDMLGLKPEDIYRDITIFRNLLDEKTLLKLIQLIKGDHDFSKPLEVPWNLPDNKIIWTESTIHPIYDSDHKLVGFEGVSRDISVRKAALESLRQSQEQLALVLTTNKDGIWDWNLATSEVRVDRRWLEMIGYSVNEISPDYNFWESSIHPDDLAQTLKLLNAHLSGMTEFYETEFRFKTKSNGFKWISTRGKVVSFDNDKRPDRMIGTHTDISQKKKNEKELLKIEKLESLATLAGGIAHDFNNILTTILGNISLSKMLLSKITDSDKIQNLLSNSEKSTYKAKELTQKLLTFSRGGTPIKKTIDPEKLVHEIIERTLQGSQTKTEIKFLSKPWFIEVDEDQVKQAIQNIITNSIDAMNNAGIIKVMVRNYNVNRKLVQDPAFDKDYYLRIDIIDEGYGIPKENLDKVFDPYFTTKPKAGGLGLSSTYAIMKNHEGHISISSTPAKGTTVTLYFPAVVESTKIKCDELKRKTTGIAKILVMDDDDFIRELLNEALTSFGYEVELTINGDETIKKYSESLDAGSPYDLIIMDLTIPGGKGGKETIIELKAIDPDIRAIVSSGYSNDPILSNFEYYGFKGIITKPYNMDVLRDAIEKIIGQ